jgi:hypothetical protein
MATPITVVTKTLTYKCPDDEYVSTDSLNKTGTVTYAGPDKTWVMVDGDTNKISLPAYTSLDDGDSIPVPPGMYRVELSAEQHTDLIIMSLIDRLRITEPEGIVDVEELLPDGSVYVKTDPLHLTTVHNITDITYDTVSSTWSLPYREQDITWDDKINIRNGALAASDGRIAPDMPNSLKQKWIDYRAALRDLPTTFGRGTDNEVSPWKVTLPTAPEA